MRLDGKGRLPLDMRTGHGDPMERNVSLTVIDYYGRKNHFGETRVIEFRNTGRRHWVKFKDAYNDITGYPHPRHFHITFMEGDREIACANGMTAYNVIDAILDQSSTKHLLALRGAIENEIAYREERQIL
jgi:hypothetical protein